MGMTLVTGYSINEELEINSNNPDSHGYQKFSVTAVSDTAGNLDVLTQYRYNGLITSALIVPGSSSALPDDQFDVVLREEEDLVGDLLKDLGLNCPNTSNTSLTYVNGLGQVNNSKLKIQATNMGSNNLVQVTVTVAE